MIYIQGIEIVQILVRIHDLPPIASDFFRVIEGQGYAAFHMEKANEGAPNKNNLDYSFLKLSLDFFG